jgi:internalin A
LTNTGVTDLSPLSGLAGLQSLDLTNTGVTDLSPLSGLAGLQSLCLSECRPGPSAAILQSFSDHPCLSELIVDEAVGVPREVLSHGMFDNCLPRLRAYFSELDLGAEAENEVKVILLGNGRVGKTQLCRRFRGEPFDDSVPSTHGIQIWREELRLQNEGEEKAFQVNWWDFGGQDIYHGTHALFLRSRAVFLILWTPTFENRDEYSENGIPLRNQPIQYWLDYVRTLAGEGSPVIVVQSQCDLFSDRRPDPPRPDGSGFFECCAYSAREDLGRETLESHLRNAIRYLLDRSGALEIGRGRAEVRRRLYEWRSEDQKREPKERQHRTLTLDEFRALCDKTGGIVSWEHALDYFHHTGVVFYQPDLFSNGIILDQDWALDAIYTVFHRGGGLSWLRERGRFTQQDLAMTVWQEHSSEEQTLFLGLVESCGVCFRCGETPEGKTRYIAPDLLPRFDAVSSRVHLVWSETANTLRLRLEYRFFHPAVIRSLMSQIGQRAGDLGEYWKYGLWFKDGRRDAQLLVQLMDTSTDEAPGTGALELNAQGSDSLGLLREIRRAILWRRIGEEPAELLTLNGTTVARSALSTVIDGRVLDLQETPVPAAAFVNFFSDREYHLDEVPADKESPGMDINPQPLNPNDKPREVFISYAWGDETPEGKIRAEAVDGLYSALEKDGFRPVRDRDQMHPGS